MAIVNTNAVVSIFPEALGQTLPSASESTAGVIAVGKNLQIVDGRLTVKDVVTQDDLEIFGKKKLLVDLGSEEFLELGSNDTNMGLTGILPISHGGTGATSPALSRENLSVYSKVQTTNAINTAITSVDTKLTQDILANVTPLLIDTSNLSLQLNALSVVTEAHHADAIQGLADTRTYIDQLVINANKGMNNFKTEVELRAFIPLEVNYTGYALDTKNTFIWDGSEWNDTGLSELELAKNYTDSNFSNFDFDSDAESIDASKNIYVRANDKLDYYVTNSTNPSPATIRYLVGTRCHVLEVRAGEVYIFNSPNLKDYVATAFSTSDEFAPNKQIEYVAYEKINNTTYKVVIPFGVNYLFFNTSVPTVSYDVSNDLVINRHYAELVSFGNSKLKDLEAHEELKVTLKKSELETQEPSPNLATNQIDGYYVTVPSSETGGRVRALSGAALQLINVEAGATYAIYSTNFNLSRFACAAHNTNVITHNMQATYLTLQDTENTNVKLVTIPSDLNYLYVTTLIASLSFDIRDGFWVNKGTESTKFIEKTVDKISDYFIRDSLAQQRLDNLDAAPSKLKGKKWIAIGDSITAKTYRANKNYHDFISEDVGGMTIYNKGISGSGFHNRMDVAETLTEDADIITVFWGTNDWGLVENTYALGDFLSTDTETISGRINTCLSALINKYPLVKIAIISALPRLTNYGSNAKPNSVGYTLKQHVELLEKYAEHYSLPFLNLYKQSNLPVWIPAANTYYFTAPTLTAPDGLHPNDAGQRIMADKIKVFLESL